MNHLNGVCMVVIPSLWVCFSIVGVPQNGYVFQSWTHTSYSRSKGLVTNYGEGGGLQNGRGGGT